MNTHRKRHPSAKSALLCAAALSLALPASAESWQERAYVRGSLGYEKYADANFSDARCSSTNPPALFGCGAGVDGRSLGAYGDFGHGRIAEIAVGARLSPLWRADISLAERSGMDYQGNANFRSVGLHQPVTGNAETTTAMLNLYLDLAALTGSDGGTIRPYLGVGAGVSHNRLGKMNFSFPENTGRHRTTETPKGERTEFAYSLMLGAEMALSRQFFLDASLRYTDLGEIGSDQGDMRMNHVAAPIRIDEIKTRLRSYGWAIGIRYAFR
ncbi:outer membrane protein [Rhodocyclus purpureus]|uniref:outer membrane protein n=1 Tax=Rhodocyclus purpureus TaxID=1067 RepID=UPI0019117DEC|nr:outer membrane beta-barrel protein [Rhodocyclus purpureus]MBK5914201.1 hypothetical protein [Rhodocyclus purpureus]